MNGDVLAQQLYDASFSAEEQPMSEVQRMLLWADFGVPQIDEYEKYRWFKISKFPTRFFGITLRSMLDMGPLYGGDDQARHDKIVRILKAGGPEWPAFVSTDGILIDGYHRIAAHRTLRHRYMSVLVGVERSGHDPWDDAWLHALGERE